MTLAMIRYPCPSCNAQRRSSSAACEVCSWPSGATPYLLSLRSQELPTVQWRLRSMFGFLTAACAALAVIGEFGWFGFMDRVVAAVAICSCFLPLAVLLAWWRRNDIRQLW